MQILKLCPLTQELDNYSPHVPLMNHSKRVNLQRELTTFLRVRTGKKQTLATLPVYTYIRAVQTLKLKN